MSLKDDLESAPKPRSGPRCVTCAWFANLNADDQDAFNDYISEPHYNRAVLFRVINEKWGFTGCESSLKYHLANHHGHGTS